MSIRARCPDCQRPSERCLCALIPSLPNTCPVLVLQHTSERKHALNTARLAVLGLQHAALWIGEQFPALPDYLAQFRYPFLLFPTEQAQTLAQWQAQGAVPDLLVVPDGTWRKARKILHHNPVLQSLPSLTLPVTQPSRYRLRKAPDPQALATIEAIAQVLTQIQPQLDYQPLLRPFEHLIEEHIQAMGQSLYERNYPAKITGATEN